MPKKRLDQLLHELDLAESRTRAQALIMAGKVRVAGQTVHKAGQLVAEDAEISVDGKDHPWVSRGGMKLAHGLAHFGIDPAGMTCIDVGSSTGGFTDVLLAGGAAKVFAVDVGHGQLDWKLRNDARVVVMEETNARYLTPEMIPDKIDMVVCDASFISLKTVLPAAMGLCGGGSGEWQVASGESDASERGKQAEPALSGAYCAGQEAEQGQTKKLLLALIKPQFEAGRERVGKGGVVRDPEVHQDVCNQIVSWLSETMGWRVLGVTESPLKGPAGNIEFLVCATRN